jgi:imidazolonepropionase-like amidohydrolase
MDPDAARRRLAAYLYSGITAVRSTGDRLDDSLKLRALINSGEYLGAEFFAYGPLFTAAGGHPTEFLKYIPESQRKAAEEQFVRLPKSAEEGRTQVDDLKKSGVDGIKAVLEAGNSEWGVFNRLDTGIYRSVMEEAAKQNLPTATHTGSSMDVKDAADAGTNSIEHGSMVDVIPLGTLEEMKQKGIAYDPTMSVFEALADLRTGNLRLLDRSLVQQVGPADLLSSTRAELTKEKPSKTPEEENPMLERENQNLVNAYKAGVLLIAGSDAGNLLVIHGPTVQHEMELWVKAGIPAVEALKAGTYNAARVLRAEGRIGSIEKGRDASLLLLDGDPVQDISNVERIGMVVFRGQRIDRSELFGQDKE